MSGHAAGKTFLAGGIHMAKWRVLIADDHPIVLAGLRATDLSREHQQPYRIEAEMHQNGIIQPSGPVIG